MNRDYSNSISKILMISLHESVVQADRGIMENYNDTLVAFDLKDFYPVSVIQIEIHKNSDNSEIVELLYNIDNDPNSSSVNGNYDFESRGSLAYYLAFTVIE